MQDTTLRVTALFTQIKLAMPVDLALIKLETQLRQLTNAFWTFDDNCADHRFFTKTGARLERIAHMKLKRIFIAGHAGDPALRPGGVCIGTFTFGDDSYRSVLCRFQRKTQTGNAAADHYEIVFLHPNRILSIKRVLPKNTATTSSEFGPAISTGRKVSASTSST